MLRATMHSGAVAATPPFEHSASYRLRRFLNWFPLGLTYALLYMGRYNLNVAKRSLSDTHRLMTKEDFGVIFFVGTLVYALSFVLNGPLVDRIGGRKGTLITAIGTMAANVAMGAYLYAVLASGTANSASLRLVFSVLYGVNMYFQSFGAVCIVKVNANWFHVGERGGFSGIFGTMIASGIFLAYTVNEWLLDIAEHLLKRPCQYVVFFAPAALLAVFAVIEALLLRDRPSDAGHADFDTGDASSADASDAPLATMTLFKRLFTHPVLLTMAGIEFCTGVLRQSIMQWFPIYRDEVWALPRNHLLASGSWDNLWVVAGCFAGAVAFGVLASRATGRRRGAYAVAAALAFLAPFVQAGWGGLLFIAGVLGSNVAGWVSDLFFQSRRAPAAGGMYAFMGIGCVLMAFTLATPTTEIASADASAGLAAGDRLLAIAGRDVRGWADVRTAVTCWPAVCENSAWDATECTCSTKGTPTSGAPVARGSATIPARVVRNGATIDVALPDPKPLQRAGDQRRLAARPVLPLTPYLLGLLVFLISVGTIGTHGVLSGTATMDFGGRKAAATAVGLIDGAVYLGTAFEAIVLGVLTSHSWSYWPPFMIPFAIIGFLLCLRIWHARPRGVRKPEPKEEPIPTARAA